MHANQTNSTGKKRNLNTRLSPELRACLDAEVARRGIDKSDLVRESLEHYLPISAMLPGKEKL